MEETMKEAVGDCWEVQPERRSCRGHYEDAISE